MKNFIINTVKRSRVIQLSLIAVLGFGLVSCEKENDPFMQDAALDESSIMDVLKKSPKKGDASIAEIAINADFNELVSALAYVDEEMDAGLIELFLNGTDQYTVFAPTDMAFMNLYDALGIGAITDLPADVVLDVLFYHVTDGRRGANSVVPPVKERRIETLSGKTFSVDSEGMIYAVGNTAAIAAADISASNGIIHVIDAVILPFETGTKAKGKGAPQKGTESIAAIAIEAGFSELVAALSYVDEEMNTGLVELFLNGKDQYTVFAPTNEAFEALYSALEIGAITDLPASLVKDVLFYHVTDGRRAANSVVPKKNSKTIETLLGETFTVDNMGMITAIGNTANIAAADISASNGIIHVIDAVILPIN